MVFENYVLPSNRKFGYFFTAVFWIGAIYAFYMSSYIWLFILSAIGLIFCCVTIIKADILLPVNKLWMKFGILLGIIVRPIVLGIIFFGLFTPIAILMRLSGRDELRLKLIKKPSHWILRDETIKSQSFKHQF